MEGSILKHEVSYTFLTDWEKKMLLFIVACAGVYLTNPLEIVPEETIMEQLMSDSVLLVRRQDVVSRFQPTASLAPLLHHPDPRWCTMNVLGVCVRVYACVHACVHAQE